MGLFDGLFGKKNQGNAVYELMSPVKGSAVSIKDVPDPTFSEEVLGKGIAVIPSDNKILSPCDGKVDLIFPTGHAVNVVSEFGTEILIHIGLDTVQLKGEGFKTFVQDGTAVKKGDLLIEFDKEEIAQKGYNTITPIVICNSDDYSEIEPVLSENVTNDDVILRLKKK